MKYVLTIGRLAKQAGVNLEAVRFYDRRGVSISFRTPLCSVTSRIEMP